MSAGRAPLVGEQQCYVCADAPRALHDGGFIRYLLRETARPDVGRSARGVPVESRTIGREHQRHILALFDVLVRVVV